MSAPSSIAVESAKRAVRAAVLARGDDRDDAHVLCALHHTLDEEAFARRVSLTARLDGLTRALTICIAKACPTQQDAARALMKSASLLALAQLETLLALPVGNLPRRSSESEGGSAPQPPEGDPRG